MHVDILDLPVYRTDLFIPTYAPMQQSEWELRIADMVLCPGYWSPTQLVHGMAALVRHGKSWMSMTPMEIESQEIGCRLATGDTVVMGLGMGWAAANAALRPEVTRVTVIERDPAVIAMNESCGVFGQLPAEAAAKLRVIEADALDWRPEQPVDTLLADIWLPLNGDDRVEQVRRMRANTGASRIYIWGQEMVIARRARDTGRAIDAITITAIVSELDLPLIGPELPDYPDLTARAAARWLRD